MRKALSALLVVLPAAAFGWGFDGHRRLASALQDPLPANLCLKRWLSDRQTAARQDRSCDPDRWRYTSAGVNYDPNEWPRHYLEIDRINPPSAYPRDWAAVMDTFPNYYERNGRVPWRVEEMYAQLVAAFRAGDEGRAIDTVFILSHYVTDSFSLLHTTRDYNPGGTLHARWESDMLDVTSQINAIATLSVGYYGTPGRADPKNNIFDILLVGNGLQPQLVAAHNANPTDMAAFFNAVKDLTARRWGDATTLLASLIWTAWAEAGAPNLTGFTATCSRSAPTAEIILRGHPVPGGFTHPDGGNPPAPDASVIIVDAGPDDGDGGCIDGTCGGDAGTGGGSGGTGGGFGFGGGWQFGAGGGGGAEPVNPPPCGCSAGPGMLAALALLLARRAKS